MLHAVKNKAQAYYYSQVKSNHQCLLPFLLAQEGTQAHIPITAATPTPPHTFGQTQIPNPDFRTPKFWALLERHI